MNSEELDAILADVTPDIYNLFVKKDTSPMTFCIAPSRSEENSQALESFKALIVKCGGTLSFNEHSSGPHMIKLANESCPCTTSGDVFKSQFILECVKKKSLIDIRNFRANASCYTDDIDVNLIMYGMKTWADAIPKWQPYTYQEEKALLHYILKRRMFSRVKGNQVWKKIAAKNICNGRTWQSLKEHYNKHMLPRLPQYPISPHSRDKILNGRKNSSSRPRKEGDDSEHEASNNFARSEGHSHQKPQGEEHSANSKSQREEDSAGEVVLPAVVSSRDAQEPHPQSGPYSIQAKPLSVAPGSDRASVCVECVTPVKALVPTVVSQSEVSSVSDEPKDLSVLAEASTPVPFSSTATDGLRSKSGTPAGEGPAPSVSENLEFSPEERSEEAASSAQDSESLVLKLSEEASEGGSAAGEKSDHGATEDLELSATEFELMCNATEGVSNCTATGKSFENATEGQSESSTYEFASETATEDEPESSATEEAENNSMENGRQQSAAEGKADDVNSERAVIFEQEATISEDSHVESSPRKDDGTRLVATPTSPTPCTSWGSHSAKGPSMEFPNKAWGKAPHKRVSSPSDLGDRPRHRGYRSYSNQGSRSPPGGRLDSSVSTLSSRGTKKSHDSVDCKEDAIAAPNVGVAKVPSHPDVEEEAPVGDDSVGNPPKRRPRPRVLTSSTASDSDESNATPKILKEDYAYMRKFLRKHRRSSMVAKRGTRYSSKEDKALIFYIFVNGLVELVRGNSIYRPMESSGLFKGRTWQGLKSCFLNRILPNIARYEGEGVPSRVIRSFLKNTLSHPPPRSHTMPPAKQQKVWKPYSYAEDKVILDFIICNRRYKHVGGNVLWKLMPHRCPGLRRRTWQSLKERFRRYILFDLKRYKLKAMEERALLSGCPSWGMKVKGRSSPSSQEDSRTNSEEDQVSKDTEAAP